MIKPEQILDEAVEAAARAIACIEHGDDFVWDTYITHAESAIAAAINVWPGAGVYPAEDAAGEKLFDLIELPLLQEKNDD